jgi:hypothetical protein
MLLLLLVLLNQSATAHSQVLHMLQTHRLPADGPPSQWVVSLV